MISIMKIETCINFLLTQAQIKVNQRFKENLNVCRVTPAQYLMLYHLWETDGLFPSRLATLSGLDSSTVTGLLTRLEEKGFITRVHSKGDRRSVLVCLTDEGRALRNDTDLIIQSSNEEVLSALNDKEQAALESLLHRMIDSLS